MMSASADLPELLLGLARDDEFAARSLLQVRGVADSILGFHCQQAVDHMRYGTSRGAGLDRDQALRWASSAIEWAQGIIESPTP
jgi:hypothetical protein